MNNLRLVICIAFLGLTEWIYASVPQGYAVLTGRVVDTSGLEIPYVTVALLRDGSYISGNTADSSGVFEIKILPGSYTLHISHISYKPFEQSLKISGTRDMGKVILEENSEGLKALVVSASSVFREADRFVVNVAGVVSMAGKDGAELLSRSPGVWVDDSGISVNGMKGAKVYINDRELKLSGEELISYLRTLTSSEIFRVEVIPQAGSEYAADSKGGIVKIILKRSLNDGLSGSVQLATSQSSRLSDYVPSANVFTKTGRWNINAALSGNFTTRGDGSFTGRREYESGGKRFNDVSDFETDSKYGRGRLEAIFEINKKHSVGAEISYASGCYVNPSNSVTQMLQNGIEINSGSRYDQRSNRNDFSGTFNYVWNIDTVGSSLKFITDYTRFATDGKNRYDMFFQWEDIHRDSLSRNFTSSRYEIITSELALNKVLSKAVSVKAGLKYSRNSMDARSEFEGKTGDNWIPYRDYSYAMDYVENIGAAYASVSLNWKRWNLSAGLRGEYTGVKGSGGVVNRDYVKLFPNVSVSYAFNTLRTWMLIGQYSRNIERPSFMHMNPIRIRMSDYSYQIGNPYLRSAYIHRLSATLVYKYRYTLTAGANLNRDLVREVCKIDPSDADVSYITPENHYMEDHYFVALSAPVMLSKRCNLSVNFVGVKQDIKFAKGDAVSSHYLMFANAVCGFNLPAGLYAELSYSGHNRLYSGNSEVAGRHLFNAALKKSILAGKLSFSASVQNFTNRKAEYVSRTGGFVSVMRGYTSRDARYFKLSVSYNFRTGREFKTRKVESSAGSERGRLQQEKDSGK